MVVFVWPIAIEVNSLTALCDNKRPLTGENVCFLELPQWEEDDGSSSLQWEVSCINSNFDISLYYAIGNVLDM